MLARLQWVESSRYRRAKLAEAGWRPRYFLNFLIGLGIGGAILGLMAWNQQPIEGNWPATIGVILPFFALILPLVRWIQTWEGDKITIGTLGIARSEMVGKSVRVTRYDWDQIVRCRLGTVVVRGEEFQALMVELASGQTASFAIDGKVLIDDIRRAIEDMGREFQH